MIEAADRNHSEEPPAPTGNAGAAGTGKRVGLSPDQVIRNDTDARIVLGLWTIRKAWFPLFWIGITVATVWVVTQGRDFNELQARIAELETGSGLLEEALTPLGLAVFAIVMRLAALPLGWAAAFPLTLLETKDAHADTNWLGRQIRLWRDRVHLTRAYATLRATWIVRYAAIDRIGAPNTILVRSIRILRWTGVVAFIAYLVTTAVAVAYLV